MAAPHTHVVVTGFLRIVLLVVFRVKFTLVEWFLFYVWGTNFLDADHFTSPDFRRDAVRRLKVVLSGKNDTGPTKGIKMPVEFLHEWPGLVIVLLLLPFFGGVRPWAIFVLLPWAVHVVFDRHQKTPSGMVYQSFFHPFKGGWVREKGYPVKSKKEVMVFAILLIPLMIFEFIIFGKYLKIF